MRTWTDVDHPRYTADQTFANGHKVVVCLDDEGPYWPCFYWEIDDSKTLNGWASSVTQAKKDAVKFAKTLDKISETV